jgi:hypothetical protein
MDGKMFWFFPKIEGIFDITFFGLFRNIPNQGVILNFAQVYLPQPKEG